VCLGERRVHRRQTLGDPVGLGGDRIGPRREEVAVGLGLDPLAHGGSLGGERELGARGKQSVNAELLRRGAELGAKAKRSREPELDEIVAIDASVRASLATPAAVA